MNDWTSGYIADINYTYGYYTELNPLRVKLAFLNAGIVSPEMGTACELGFGQGVSANFHAAASVTQWWGTDFNPSQAGFGQELAAISGSGAKLFDEAFADFANRPELPDFDYIGLHGIWSWISNENRAVVVDFIRRKLKVGGVLYISYNTLPGWAPFAPIRHLMTKHAEVIGAEGHGIVTRVEGAIAFTEKLLTTNPAYARVNPQISERIKNISVQNRNYLAHEYFNRDWHPIHFATMAEWLEPAKLSFACSAHYMDIDSLDLTTEQQNFLKEIPDTMFKESVRDFMINRQFRSDYWVKGLRRLSILDKTEMLRSQSVMLMMNRETISFKITQASGENTFSEEVFTPILDILTDFKPRTLGQIEQALKDQNMDFSLLNEAVMIMIGIGVITIVQDDTLVAKAKLYTDRLNAYLLKKAQGSNDINFLVSPVTGGGVTVSRIQQLFLLATSQGKKQPVELAAQVWQILDAQCVKMVKDGNALLTNEENLRELVKQANALTKKQLPILKALQIA